MPTTVFQKRIFFYPNPKTSFLENGLSADGPDYRDIVIEELARSEADLRARNAALEARVASLEADVGIYRELGQAAFDALHRVTQRLTRVTDERNQLRQEKRDAREHRLLELGADDNDKEAA